MSLRFALRLAIALVAIGLAFLSWRDAARAYWLASDPRKAPAWLRGDPRLAAAQADVAKLSLGQIDPVAADAIARNARRQLAIEPLSPTAMRDIALVSLVRGDSRAIAQLRFAERLGRRDALTQLALLDQAAATGDNEALARHFDRAVTVHPELAKALFARLAPLLGERDLRAQLAHYAAKPWFAAFLNTSLDQPEKLDWLADLMLRTNIDLSGQRSALLAKTLRTLTAAGRNREARAIAQKLGQTPPGALDDFALSAITTRQDLAPFAWRLGNDRGVTTQWSKASGLQIDLDGGTSAVLLDRQTSLAPGLYQLDQRLGNLSGAGTPDLLWQVDCLRAVQATAIWRQPVPLGPDPKHYRSTLRVPNDCSVQRWRLRALAMDGQTGASFTIASLSLEPIR
ncbi:hypothetical protein [Novosphingobium album (ex Liu et al. 2023)]|uniref:Tetratricopeptide repeat protein n=1 Tax=Novosphingobium album (ex Liu et al. 2023) TaxID=3031130 RepID=A0ABT5WSI7_9SPHN|nr:hypothetical protein [Novosphingobium album (ex Liu et al. 2023)]MDE8653005.1 hypothetical protein [Novosphingobium album (ex Liu et al. 2023)]